DRQGHGAYAPGSATREPNSQGDGPMSWLARSSAWHAGRHYYRPRLESLEDRTLLSTCTVTRLSDAGLGQGLRGDLRYCINYANGNPGPDTIDFKVTGTIKPNSALPQLATDITITGPGANLLAVDPNGLSFRVFTVPASGVVSISGLTVTHG